MLEIIGFIVWFVVTIGLTLMPVVVIGLSGLGGGFKRTDAVICLVFITLASVSWYGIFSKLTITLN